MTMEPTKPHILIIDSAPAVRALMRDLLEGEGFRVTTRAYPLPDLDEIKGLAPDLIIVDYLIPGHDLSRSLLQALKMDPDMHTIPIVLCTGAAREVQTLGGYLTAMGITVVLKPFDIEELIAVINSAVHSRTAA